MTKRIESEVKRECLTDLVTRWCEYTKVAYLLRDHDIPGLVRQILGEFYCMRLCCGHLVRSIDEGVHIAFYDCGGMVSGTYCEVCAEDYKKKLGAWEVYNGYFFDETTD